MESLSRISSALETARDLTIDAATSAARKSSSTRPMPPQALRKLLDSRRDAEILDGLRRVISMSYNNQQVLQYFSAVIKNIASPNIEIKKLVYAFLIRHAEADPDTALLSINTIQKSLSDANPQTRALALRTMSSIRVPVISQIVALGIKRGAGDMSPIVRKAAALAIPKCYRLDPSQLPLLTDQIEVLLGDRQYYVAGAAVTAFLDICPERLDMVHPQYRGLVKKLVDMDEWGQLATLRLMLQYGRKCFPWRTKKVKQQKSKQPRDFYEEIPEKEEEDEGVETIAIDPDLELLLTSMRSLLQSRNSAVIIAVVRCYLYLGTSEHLALAVGPLISLLRASTDIQSAALPTVLDICRQKPSAFAPYTTRFLIKASDSPEVISSKLELLSILFPYVTSHLQSLILTDLAQLTQSTSSSVVRGVVVAIGRCARTAPSDSLKARCLQLLLDRLSSPDSTLVDASLEEIRILIQHAPETHLKIVVRLAKNLDTLRAPRARAAIVWLVGEFASAPDSANIGADVWRILLKNYPDEDELVQAQILLLAAKAYLHHVRAESPDQEQEADNRIKRMLDYTYELTRWSSSYALRDRARFLQALTLGGPSTDLGALMLLAPKPVPTSISSSKKESKGVIGNASWLLGVRLPNNEEVPPWTDVEVGAKERAGTVESAATSTRSTLAPASERLDSHARDLSEKRGTNGVTRTLDDWLAEDDEKAAQSEEESEEETDELETDSDEYETDSEEEEETDEDDNDERSRLVT